MMQADMPSLQEDASRYILHLTVPSNEHGRLRLGLLGAATKPGLKLSVIEGFDRERSCSTHAMVAAVCSGGAFSIFDPCRTFQLVISAGWSAGWQGLALACCALRWGREYCPSHAWHTGEGATWTPGRRVTGT
jgi:hypothetical protein